MEKVEDIIKGKNENKVVSEYNSIISKLKQGNVEAELLNESNAQATEGKLRDLFTELNSFEPSETIDNEIIKNLDNELQNQKKLLLSNISLSLAKQKKYDEAIKNEKKLLKKDPKNIESNKRILDWFLENKKLQEAIKFSEEIRQKFKDDKTSLNEFKKYFDIIDKANSDSKAFMEGTNKTETKSTKSEIMEYVVMFVLAIILRFIIRYFKSKYKKTMPPTNQIPTNTSPNGHPSMKPKP